MKIYYYQAPPLLFVTIKRIGDKPEHITLYDATKEECLVSFKDIIRHQNLDVFAEGRKTTIEIRDYINGENGKMVSFNFKGLSPQEVHAILVRAINKANDLFEQ